MTDQLRQAAQQLLEACEQRLPLNGQAAIIDELNDLRTALKQQAEPVGEVIDERGEVDYISYVPPVGTVLYATPPQRKPLTDEAIWLAYQQQWHFHPAEEPNLAKGILQFARAIEAAHGIKEGT